jgi:Mg2+ and Co2+ transporter CorA
MRYSNVRFACYCVFLSFFVTACAGKDDVAPIDVEKQAFADLRAEINAVIDDSERAENAVRIVSTWEQDLARLREGVAARRQRVLEINADYDTPRSEFESYFEDVRSEILKSKQRAVESYREFSSYMTEDELDAISKSQTKAMKAFSKTIESI